MVYAGTSRPYMSESRAAKAARSRHWLIIEVPPFGRLRGGESLYGAWGASGSYDVRLRPVAPGARREPVRAQG
ncbi:hypothetical protein GCM10009801_65840 [Streptomyces albiaxialis]|uniref:Uncharacterized protein n=1 Tax=Streptomyces albiaxialis TaxID=329523 RepID=A0ABN2WPG4_9ACTN